MTILTEKQRAGEHIVREVDLNLSRKKLILTGASFKAGSVLGVVTASGKAVLFDPAASDGSQNVAGILFADVDASTADKKGIVNHALTVFKPELLVWKTGITDVQKAAALVVLSASHCVGA